MTDEEMQELRRAALAGDKDALERLEVELTRERAAEPQSEPAEAKACACRPSTDGLCGLDSDDCPVHGTRSTPWVPGSIGSMPTPSDVIGTAVGVALSHLASRVIFGKGTLGERIRGALEPETKAEPRAPRKRRRKRGKAT